MATIKSFTDLQQSRKLKEFLPLESADMYYEEVCNLPKAIVGNYILHNQCMEDKDYKKLSNPVLSPAWSLAALISILPRSIEFKGDKYFLRFMKEYVEYANDEISITGRCLHTTGNDNLVDACVELILKLNELNLL